MKRGATTELKNDHKKIKYDLIELQRQFDEVASTIKNITDENRDKILYEINHFLSKQPIEHLDVNNFLQTIATNSKKMIVSAQSATLVLEILEKIISENIEKINWHTTSLTLDPYSGLPLFMLIPVLLEDALRGKLPEKNVIFLVKVLNEFIANPNLKIDWSFNTKLNMTLPAWCMLVMIAERAKPEFLQNFIYNSQYHGVIGMWEPELDSDSLIELLCNHGTPASRRLAGQLYLLNKNLANCNSNDSTNKLIKEINLFVNNLSAKLWHFNSLCKDLPEDIVKVLNCHIIIEELNDYLTDGTDGTNEQKEAFAWYLLTSGRFNYQPEQAEIDKGNVDSASLQNLLDKKSYDFTSILATSDYRDMRPMSQLALFSHPNFNSTVHKRISKALDDLRSERKLPSFLNYYQRENITHVISSMNNDFTLADIKKTIQSAMK
ncbi:hypothetical protein [Candidatus Berkiella aquae]|uniref:Uncharacterized protein n=1 Tax=Candidatus Berkiella aquae TaxID=295108 RepID=A0A0Q9YVZ6_9GAMM|nr:hypothetical protein [Candidatus Berkiella aquae]MCS5711348.1 hypothetical protein [Candidatus Berkiella aquae]